MMVDDMKRLAVLLSAYRRVPDGDAQAVADCFEAIVAFIDETVDEAHWQYQCDHEELDC